MHDNDTFTGERTVWYNPASHLKEFKIIADFYMEAMAHAVGKRVVDVGCGKAFGTFLLSLVAREVFGIDKSAEAFPTLEQMLPNKAHTKFLEIDLDKEPVDITADLCVAIEVLEHLEDPHYFLQNLKAQSIFFTIPCYGDKNPFHKIEYDEQKAADMIRAHFPNLTYRMEARRMVGYAFKNQPLP